MSLEEDAAALRAIAETVEELWNKGSGLKEEVAEQIDAIYNVTGPSAPESLQEAVTFLRSSMQSIEEGQAFLTTVRDALTEYCTSIGY
jgi:hypothetical protein